MWRETIETNGFAIIPDVVSAGRVASLVEDLASWTAQPGTRRTRAGIRHALRFEGVAALAREPGLLEIARESLGSAAFPFRATLFDKSPDANWLVVWHQDRALPLRVRCPTPGWGPWSVKDGVIYAHAPASALSQVLALRVHLDDSTARNGPLRVLPGTHMAGVLSDDEVHKLARDVAPVDCIVSRGGVLAMRPLLVHASSKSEVASVRRVLHIEYAASANFAEGLELAVA